METKLEKVFFDRFKHQMAMRFPEFKLVGRAIADKPRSGLFQYALAENLVFHVQMFPAEYEHCVNVYAGYMEQAGHPHGMPLEHPMDFPELDIQRQPAKNGICTFEIQRLWQPVPPQDWRERRFASG